MFALTRQAWRRARQERLAQVAGSLAFTTVLSLVPFLAVSFALFTRFPVFRRFETALEDHLLKSLLPLELSRTVLRHLDRFAANANALTLAGSCFLLLAAVALLLTVENAFNQIWGVKRNRPLLRRIGMYLLLLAAGPPLLGVSLWATSTVRGASAGWVGHLPPALAFVLTLGPLLISTLGVAALFRFVPNTAVRWGDALAGGLIAGLALEGGKRAFGAWVLKLPTYQAVYGAFAAVPAFLLWVYFSWLVTLAAALVAAGLGQGGARQRAPKRPPAVTAAR
jgi:membrane protein